MEQHHKSLGAWLPAPILYNHTITPRQKILYCTIFNLSNQKGYCWATNGYFANEFDVSHDSVGRDIKALVDANLINTEMIPNVSGTERRIRIEGGIRTSAERGIRTSAVHKKINNNNISPLVKLIDDNPKMLKRMPLSIDGHPVSPDEAKFICQATAYYNANRRNGLWFMLPERKGKPAPESNRHADSKACKEIIRRYRDGWTIEKLDGIIVNMFDAEYHQKSNFMYLSLEFCHRQDKLEMYENAA